MLDAAALFIIKYMPDDTISYDVEGNIDRLKISFMCPFYDMLQKDIRYSCNYDSLSCASSDELDVLRGDLFCSTRTLLGDEDIIFTTFTSEEGE